LPKVQSPVKPLVSYQSYRQLSGWPRTSMRLERPRVRDLAGRELMLPSWDRAVAEDWLGKWAMNLMLINMSRRGNSAARCCFPKATFRRRRGWRV
jgi:hypothetical protein